MKHAVVITVFLAAMVAGCGTFKHKTETSLESIPENERPNIETHVTGELPVNALTGMRVFVSFKNSEKLTKVLSDLVENKGGKTVSTAEQADLTIEAVGGFFAIRATRSIEVDAGEVIEKSGIVPSKGKRLEFMAVSGNATVPVTTASLFASGIKTIFNITGFSDHFNGLVAGDPDGVCFAGCEYKQAAIIGVILKSANGEHIGESKITSNTAHKKLWPVPLIDSALSKLASAEVWKQ